VGRNKQTNNKNKKKLRYDIVKNIEQGIGVAE
jgi:hypothetical protein